MGKLDLNANLTVMTNRNNTLLHKTLRELLHLFMHSKNPSVIDEGLKRVLSYYNADIICTGRIDKDTGNLIETHEILADDADKAVSYPDKSIKTKRRCEASFPWWSATLQSGQDIIGYDVDNLPPEAEKEQSILQERGVKSFIYTPLYCQGDISGYMGMEYLKEKQEWLLSDADEIHFFSDTFSILLEKEQMQKKINKSSIQLLKDDAIFEIIFNTLPIGVELYDEDGYLLRASPYDQNLFGVKEEDLLGVNLFENPTIDKIYLDKIRNGEAVEFVNDYYFDEVNAANYYKTSKHKGVIRLLGKCIPLKHDDGAFLGYLMLVHNDESYYKKKEEIQTNLAKLKMVVNNNTAYFWEYDVKNDEINVDLSLLEASSENKLLMDPFLVSATLKERLNLIHADDVERLEHNVKRVLLGEVNTLTETYREKINGKYRWLSTCFTVYKYDEENKPETIVCLSNDITERRNSEVELIKAKEANVLKNAFIENMSHELRTPLNAIVGFSSILAETCEQKENSYYIDIIQKNNEQLLRIIDSILSFTKIETNAVGYVIEEVDVNNICLEAISIKSFNRSPNVAFLFDDNLPSVVLKTDREHIKQVLYHLLDNASKFTKSGSVTLTYKEIDNSHICIMVKDTGIGMTPKEIERIFTHFYKTNLFEVGIGLGLTISQKIINDLGGRIEVESEKGRGSTFKVILPMDYSV